MKLLLAYTEKRKTLDLIYEEGLKRGHEIILCDLSKLEFRNGILFSEGTDISNVDLVYFRDIRQNIEEQRLITNYFRNKGIGTFDIRLTKNFGTSKIGTAIDLLNNNLPYPKTYSNFTIKDFSKNKQEEYFDFLQKNLGNKFIMKPVDGRHGNGVYLIDNFNDFINNHQNDTMFMYQEFIENDGDLRIIVIGGKTIGAILRKGKDGSFINNVALGGEASLYELDENLSNIAINAAEILFIDVAGVDIILDKKTGNPYILEINRSPEFEGFMEATGINIPAKIFDFLESQI